MFRRVNRWQFVNHIDAISKSNAVILYVEKHGDNMVYMDKPASDKDKKILAYWCGYDGDAEYFINVELEEKK